MPPKGLVMGIDDFHRNRSLGLAPLLAWALLCLPLISAETHAETIRGQVQVEGHKALKNLIVYLEPETPKQGITSSLSHQVSQKGRNFNPDLLVIGSGDKVQWLNDEDREVDHNVYSLNRIKSFDLGLHERGSIMELTLKKVGHLTYFCSVHKRMGGRLIVLPSRYFTVLEKPGTFIIPNVPRGDWTLHIVVFHRRYTFDPISISVGAKTGKVVVLKVVKR